LGRDCRGTHSGSTPGSEVEQAFAVVFFVVVSKPGLEQVRQGDHADRAARRAERR
jgi:hypothetical protein